SARPKLDSWCREEVGRAEARPSEVGSMDHPIRNCLPTSVFHRAQQLLSLPNPSSARTTLGKEMNHPSPSAESTYHHPSPTSCSHIPALPATFFPSGESVHRSCPYSLERSFR